MLHSVQFLKPSKKSGNLYFWKYDPLTVWRCVHSLSLSLCSVRDISFSARFWRALRTLCRMFVWAAMTWGIWPLCTLRMTPFSFCTIRSWTLSGRYGRTAMTMTGRLCSRGRMYMMRVLITCCALTISQVQTTLFCVHFW